MSFPMGLGHDICHIPRIYKILTSQRGPRFIERVLTKQELQRSRPQALLKCVFAKDLTNGQTSPNPEQAAGINSDVAAKRDPTFWKAAEYMAGRFAAKEAAIKAFPQQRLNFENIQIINQVTHPRTMPGEVGPSLPDTHEEHVQVAPHNEQRGSGPPLAIIQIEGCPQKQSAMLSISHDGDYASAVCIYMPGGPQDS